VDNKIRNVNKKRVARCKRNRGASLTFLLELEYVSTYHRRINEVEAQSICGVGVAPKRLIEINIRW
jgi:hypothetical protein